MNRKRLKKIFFETDILPWIPSFGLPPLGLRLSAYWRRVFLHQLSSCIESGVDLPRAVDLCLRGRFPWRLRGALRRVRSALEEGMLLSEALRRNAPKIFPRSFYGIIEIGERSGTLSDMLTLLNRQYADALAVQRRAIAAILYPAFLLLVCILAALFYLIQVLPTFAEIYGDLGGKMPALTRALLAVNRFLVPRFLPLMGVLLCLIVGALVFVFLSRRIAVFSKMALRIPPFGPLILHSNVFYLGNLMSLLVRAGASEEEALSLCENDALAPAFRRDIERTRRGVSEGKALSEALAEGRMFSSTVIWLVSIGEKRNNLADSLKAAAEFEHACIQDRLTLLSRLVNPVAAITISIVIGLVIVGVAIPFARMPFLLI